MGVVFLTWYTSLLQPKPAVEQWVDEFWGNKPLPNMPWRLHKTKFLEKQRNLQQQWIPHHQQQPKKKKIQTVMLNIHGTENFSDYVKVRMLHRAQI